MDDYHAFTNTSGDGSGGLGCAIGCLPWLLIGLVILYLIGKLA